MVLDLETHASALKQVSEVPSLHMTWEGIKRSSLLNILGIGSNVLVAGTAIFGADDPKKVITELKTAVNDEISKQQK